MAASTFLFLLVAYHLDQNPIPAAPSTLGSVAWERDFSHSVERSRREGKPILILFTSFEDEETAIEYGEYVLSHPLLTEAIETLFIPLAINNEGGQNDQKVMNQFGEPRGNKPVVRIFEPDSQLPEDRLAGNYSDTALAMTMIIGLNKRGKTPPVYLRIIAGEEESRVAYFFPEEKSSLHYIPMTRKQLQLVTHALNSNRDESAFLSPNQRFLHTQIAEQMTKMNQEAIQRLARKKSIPDLLALFESKRPKSTLH